MTVTGAVTQGQEQLTGTGLKADNLGGLFETAIELTPKVAVFGRYDYFDPNRDKTADHLSGPVVGTTYRFTELGRAVFEYHKQGRKPASGAAMPWEYRLEVSFMF